MQMINKPKTITIMKSKTILLLALTCAFVTSSCGTDENDFCNHDFNREQFSILCYEPKGNVEEIKTVNNGIIYLDLADSTYFCGDVIFSKDQVEYLINPATRSAAIKDKVKYWPNKKIDYIFANTFSDTDKNNIKKAMANISLHTGIVFTETKKTGNYYLKFNLSNGNSSMIGMTKGGNTINYAANQVIGVYMHEIMHALGYFHEHTRTDRDNYVNILTNNIENGKQHNFEKYEIKYLGYDIGDFDFNSIMLYSSYAFGKEGTKTITIKNGGGIIYSNRVNLSEGDIKGLKFIYGPETIKLKKDVIEDNSTGDREDVTYSNSVYFTDNNGKEIAIDHQRLIVVEYSESRQCGEDSNNTGYSSSTYYYIVPTGAKNFDLGSSFFYYEEEGYGILHEMSRSSYSIYKF